MGKQRRIRVGTSFSREPFPKVDTDVDRGVLEYGYGEWFGLCPYCRRRSGLTKYRSAARDSLKFHMKKCPIRPRDDDAEG